VCTRTVEKDLYSTFNTSHRPPAQSATITQVCAWQKIYNRGFVSRVLMAHNGLPKNFVCTKIKIHTGISQELLKVRQIWRTHEHRSRFGPAQKSHPITVYHAASTA